MILVAHRSNGLFFRAKSVESDVEVEKNIMTTDVGEELSFQVMTEQEFKAWEDSQPIPPNEPTEIDYLLDLDFRISMIELGL